MQVYFSAGLGESNEASYEFGVEKKKKNKGGNQKLHMVHSTIFHTQFKILWIESAAPF